MTGGMPKTLKLEGLEWMLSHLPSIFKCLNQNSLICKHTFIYLKLPKTLWNALKFIYHLTFNNHIFLSFENYLGMYFLLNQIFLYSRYHNFFYPDVDKTLVKLPIFAFALLATAHQNPTSFHPISSCPIFITPIAKLYPVSAILLLP